MSKDYKGAAQLLYESWASAHPDDGRPEKPRWGFLSDMDKEIWQRASTLLSIAQHEQGLKTEFATIDIDGDTGQATALLPNGTANHSPRLIDVLNTLGADGWFVLREAGGEIIMGRTYYPQDRS